MPRFETTTEALVACVKAAGGSKQVGFKVFPEKTVDQAQRHLLNCLSDGRPERLTPDQVVLIARLAREVGCHAYAEHVAETLGYADPQPVEPKDELADLLRQFNASTQQHAEVAARLERLLQQQATSPKLRAAA
jgi:hypothetical protein